MTYEYWRRRLRARLLDLARKHDLATAEYCALARLQPGNAHILNILGYRHAQAREWRSAIDCFDRAVSMAPDDAQAHFNLGFAYEQLGEYGQAAAQFEQAVALRRTLDRAWYGLGMSYARLGRHEEAVGALSEATALQPMNAIAWYALGMAHHVNAAPEKVEEVVRHLHRFDPVMTRRLIQDSGRADLAHLVRDLRV